MLQGCCVQGRQKAAEASCRINLIWWLIQEGVKALKKHRQRFDFFLFTHTQDKKSQLPPKQQMTYNQLPSKAKLFVNTFKTCTTDQQSNRSNLLSTAHQKHTKLTLSSFQKLNQYLVKKKSDVAKQPSYLKTAINHLIAHLLSTQRLSCFFI